MTAATTDGPDVLQIAEKQRHIYLVNKLNSNKPLTRKELEELRKFEQAGDDEVGCVVRTQEEVARVFGRSTRTIQYWVKDGMPVLEDGRYELSAINDWLLKRQNKRSGDGVDYQEQYRKMKAALAELDLKERMGELLSAEEVERERVQRILIVKKALLALPAQLSPILVGKEVNEINQIITRKLYEVINEFAGENGEANEHRGHNSDQTQHGQLRPKERPTAPDAHVPKDREESGQGHDSPDTSGKDAAKPNHRQDET